MGGGAVVKLGLLTAAFPRMNLEQVAKWASDNGFGMIEVACWPAAGGERRRYAGVSHIDVDRLDVEAVHDILYRYGLEISSLAYYPNNLHPDRAERKAANTHLRKVVTAAEKLGVPIVGTFVGRDRTKTVPENFREFKRVWPRLVAHAEERGVSIAIENCPMLFSWDEWPGGTNLASTPAVWDEMFSLIPSERFGLNLDPSHLVWLQIDYERVVRRLRLADPPRARQGHGDRPGRPVPPRHRVARHGLAGTAPAGSRRGSLGSIHRRAVPRVGYDYVVSIEHEDREFERTEELVKRGFLLSRDVLMPYIV